MGRIKLNLCVSPPKIEKEKIGTFDIQYGEVKIKKYLKVTYLGYELDESLSGEAMALKVVNKINGMLTFFYTKNRYLTPYLKRLLCNALIQRHFDYTCSAWYPDPNMKFKSKLQTIQNKCIRCCPQLDNKSHIGMKDFEKINWLPVSERFNQYLCSNAFKYLKETCPLYFHDTCK